MINAHITVCLMLSAKIVCWSGYKTQFIVICHILVPNTHSFVSCWQFRLSNQFKTCQRN